MKRHIQPKPLKQYIKYVAEGVQSDCEFLMKKFEEGESLRFTNFSRLWREYKFPLIFMGRTIPNELEIFVSECFKIILSLFDANSELITLTSGLYLLHCFYLKQPLYPKVKIRLTNENCEALDVLNKMATEQEHTDILFILNGLKISGAFHYVATATKMGPRSCLEDSEKSGVSSTQSQLQALCKSEALNRSIEFHDKYEKVKQVIPHASSLLNVTTNVGEEILAEVKKIIVVEEEPLDDDEEQNTSDEERALVEKEFEEQHGNRQRSLKDRQYAKSNIGTKLERIRYLKENM